MFGSGVGYAITLEEDGGRGPGGRIGQSRGIKGHLQTLPPTLVGVGEQARAQVLAGLATDLLPHELDGRCPLSG